MTTLQEKAAAFPVTLQDLYAREAACRVAPDYSTGYEDHKRAAMTIQIQMAAYRLMPKLSWPGGPYWGAEVATPDIRYALFNLAGGLQLALRLRLDAMTKMKLDPEAFKMKLEDAPLTEMVMLGDYKKLATNADDLNLRLARCLYLLDNHTKTAASVNLPWLYVQHAAPVLFHMGLTVNDLAAAYFEATNPLVPTPEQAKAEAEGGIGGVYYPGSGQPLSLEDLTPAEDPNGPEWAAVKTLAGAYRGQCVACGQAQTVATPQAPEPCPRCAATIVQPYNPKPEDSEPLY